MLQALAYMLTMPWADHSEAVAALLAGEQLRELQAFGLRQLAKSEAVKRCKGIWRACSPRGGAFAYHTWLFHLLGGAAAKLLPPSIADTSTAYRLYTAASESEARYKKEIDRLRQAEARAAVAGAGDAVCTEVQSFRLRLFDRSGLQPFVASRASLK